MPSINHLGKLPADGGAAGGGVLEVVGGDVAEEGGREGEEGEDIPGCIVGLLVILPVGRFAPMLAFISLPL
jgi:hypothetical protein